MKIYINDIPIFLNRPEELKDEVSYAVIFRFEISENYH